MTEPSPSRTFRCPHCHRLHSSSVEICPETGASITPTHVRAEAFAETVGFGPGAGAARAPHGTTQKDPASPANAAAGAAPGEPRKSQPAHGGASAERLIGRLIDGKYKVEKLIGQGGMGAVLRAEHVRLRKPVAVKVLLNEQLRGTQFEDRFYREAQLAGSIGHPNILEVFDLGTLPDGAPYLVMELLVGESLADRLASTPLPPIDEVVRVVGDMLSALAAAHAAGIVHRDIKPENVFLARRRDGATVTKLLDFGISKDLRELTEDNNLTAPGMLLGTPYYFAPEQATASREFDHRVDIWATGVVLYEALAGRLPFDADNLPALFAQILLERPVPPSVLRPDVGTAFDHVVLTALARQPAGRFLTANAMLRALEQAAEQYRRGGRDRAAAPPPLLRDEGTGTTRKRTVAARPGAGAPTRGRPRADNIPDLFVDDTADIPSVREAESQPSEPSDVRRRREHIPSLGVDETDDDLPSSLDRQDAPPAPPPPPPPPVPPPPPGARRAAPTTGPVVLLDESMLDELLAPEEAPRKPKKSR